VVACIVLTAACGGRRDGGTGDSGATYANPAECASPFPALACDGDPVGTWVGVGKCFELYEDCPGASVSVEVQELEMTLTIGMDGTVSGSYRTDFELRTFVPKSCIGGACATISCMDYDFENCGCSHGSAESSGWSGTWSPAASGAPVLIELGSPDAGTGDTMQFCATATRGESMHWSERLVWERSPP